MKRVLFVVDQPCPCGICNALSALLSEFDYSRFEITVLFTISDPGWPALQPRLSSKCKVYVADRRECVSFERPYPHLLMSRIARILAHARDEFDRADSGCFLRLAKCVLRTRPFCWLVRPFGILLEALEARLYVRYVRQSMPRSDFDTVVLYAPYATEVAVRAFTWKQFLLVYHNGIKENLPYAHVDLGYRTCDRFIGVSHELVPDLQKWWPQYAQKMMAIPNAVETGVIRSRAEEAIAETFSSDVVNIVSCGRLCYWKGMDLAIEAVRLLVSEGGAKVHLWIIGWDVEYDRLKCQIEEAGLTDTVSLLGARENPYPYMRQADIYLQPSRKEAFGLTIQEALLLERPVVATRTRGSVELIEKRQLKGVLCEISAAGICAALRPLVADRSARDALQNRDLATRLDADRRESARQFEKLFDEV